MVKQVIIPIIIKNKGRGDDNMPFVVVRKLDLSYLGDEWKAAYLNFRGLTFKETREFATLNLDTENPENTNNLEAVLKLLQEHFIDGKAYDGTALVDVNVDDLQDLPMDAISQSVEALASVPNPKS